MSSQLLSEFLAYNSDNRPSNVNIESSLLDNGRAFEHTSQ